MQLLVVGVLGAALLAGYAVVQINAQGDRDEQRKADAIVVLGAAQYNGTPSAVFVARLEHAVSLFKDGVAPLLIVTGGKLPGDRTTEAATARKWAVDNGVPDTAILGENKGRNTFESVRAVAEILRDNGLRSAVFVSDETHMLRVLRMAEDEGIEGWGSPTRTSPTDQDGVRRSKAVLHELAGLAAYYAGWSEFFEDPATATTP